MKKCTTTDKYMIVTMIIGACMGAIGLLAFWGGITGTDIGELGAGNVVGILMGLFAGLFAGMLLSVVCHNDAKCR